jgi:hypothetical protein
MKNEVLLKITIPAIPRQVQISKSQKPKYYDKDRLSTFVPKKYHNPNFIWKKDAKGRKTLLFDVKANEFVVKNANVAGKPKHHIISGNDVWDVKYNRTVIEIVKISLQEHLWSCIKHFYPETPTYLREEKALRIHLKFYAFNEKQDTDNFDLLYRKALADAIQDNSYNNEVRLIPNDNVIKSFYTDIIPVKSKESEQLVIEIIKCEELYLDYKDMLIEAPKFLKQLNKE